MAGSSGQGGSPTVITGVQPPQKPLNLLNAVSEIQLFSSVEKNISQPLNPNYFTTQNRIDFFTVGVKNAMTHLLFTIIFTPLSIAVFHRLIHIFGDKELSLFNEIYTIFLMFSVSIGFAIFLASLKDSYVGTVTKLMVKSLFQGLLVGEIFKIIVAFIVYQFIYIQLTPAHIASLILFLNKYAGSLLVNKLHVDYVQMFYWILDFRNVFPISIVFVIIGSLILIGFPTAAIILSIIKNKQKVDID